MYAAYGGVFVVLPLLWSWWVDGVRPDRYGLLGGTIARRKRRPDLFLRITPDNSQYLALPGPRLLLEASRGESDALQPAGPGP